jgi:hypothetical protein
MVREGERSGGCEGGAKPAAPPPTADPPPSSVGFTPPWESQHQSTMRQDRGAFRQRPTIRKSASSTASSNTSDNTFRNRCEGPLAGRHARDPGSVFKLAEPRLASTGVSFSIPAFKKVDVGALTSSGFFGYPQDHPADEAELLPSCGTLSSVRSTITSIQMLGYGYFLLMSLNASALARCATRHCSTRVLLWC